ncbi:hypothetical protein DT603_07495 [Pseudoxanthomonas gei]|uniref:Copper resistance protein NlpE n=1 Tax=Pseudoxanthomonas gei TaxID=1383030 RepID=A0ABX0AAV1_9GAMM|nr:hypothetical protein [Pseudoxanthomonas gei]NDK38683.1 hypothetical protein [Pseudoxanthomonas gei]
MKAARRSAILALALATLTACKREEPAAPPASETPAASTVPAQAANPVDATAVVDNSASTAAPGLDSKALAGQFGDGESVLELRADGTYLQTLQAGGSTITADGSWSAPAQGVLLLDPNSKSAEDASFQMASNDELRSTDGKHVFRRISPQ